MKIKNLLKKLFISIAGERKWAEIRYKKTIGKKIDLDNPKTLNEKIVWLKLNYYEKFYEEACDKYLIHKYLENNLGKDYAPELLYVTQDIRNLKLENIPEFPCIIKVSNGSGSNLIVNTKDEYSDEYLQNYFKKQIEVSNMHVLTSLEHQYLKKNPYIVVERLLSDGNGGIPNDYKFMYFNGELQFIYCSVDRLGSNVRHIYDEHWNRLHFIWVSGANKELFDRYEKSPDIEKPNNFDKMKELAKNIAQKFPMVRVDFYEEGNKLYIGEITLHHGSGGDRFYPEKYDEIYGEKLKLPSINK